MSERFSDSGQDPVADAVGTVALFLSVTAVIAVAVWVAGLARGQVDTPAGIIAAISLAASMACFTVDGRRRRERERLAALERLLLPLSPGCLGSRLRSPGSEGRVRADVPGRRWVGLSRNWK